MKMLPEIGDFITVTEWTSHTDNSYKGDVLEVLVVDYPLLRVTNHSSGFMTSPMTIDLTRLNVRELSKEFVANVLEFKAA